MRRLIKTSLQVDPRLRVVCEAKHGQEAVQMLPTANPDVIVMDVEMPVMDGIDAVREIRKRNSYVPIIMFSSLTTNGAQATLDAIEAGATDFSAKPANLGHVEKALEHVRKDLIPKMFHWVKIQLTESMASSGDRPPQANDGVSANATKPESQSLASQKQVTTPISAIGIGVSTGGPKALAELIDSLPLDFPAPILIAQHMPPVFTGLLAERLAARKGHRVREATDGEVLKQSEILVAPGDFHLVVQRAGNYVRAGLNQSEPENSCRPSVDPLFRSMAECYGKHCVGVVLTGMGRDGEQGVRALRAQGASILVQDEQSSVVWGMPGNLVRSGLADQVLPLEQLAAEVVRMANSQPSLAI